LELIQDCFLSLLMCCHTISVPDRMAPLEPDGGRGSGFRPVILSDPFGEALLMGGKASVGHLPF
jgi:hypothetical protein